MISLMSLPRLPEMETEEGKILSEVVQILNYICGAPTISREELAANVMGVATTCLQTLEDHKQKISSLENELIELKNGNERASHDEDNLTDVMLPISSANLHDSQVDQPLMDSLIGAAVVSSSAEDIVGAPLGHVASAVVAECFEQPSDEMVTLEIIDDVDVIQVAKEEVELLDSFKYMNGDNNQLVDEGENVQPLSSKPSSTSTHEINILKSERSGCSDEEPSVQEVWDDSELVNSDHMVVVSNITSARRENVEQISTDTDWFTNSHLTSEHHLSDVYTEEQATRQDDVFMKGRTSYNDGHFDVWDYSKLVNSDHMVLFDNITSARRENVEQTSTDAAWFTNSHLTSEHHLTDVYTEEQATRQDAFFMKGRTSNKRRRFDVWDYSKLVNRSPQQQERETWCTTYGCTAPPKRRTHYHSNTNVMLPNYFANLHESQEDQLQMDSLIGATIMSSSSEYVVGAVLGRGVSGVVAGCFRRPSDEMVALKIIEDKRLIKVAKKEAVMLDSLKALGSEDFSIVSCISSFIFDNHFCMEFKMLDTNLWNFIHDTTFLTLNVIRPILQQVAVALLFLKRAGVVHTDLKPDNIMLVDRRQQPLKLQVIDFGLAIREPKKLTAGAFQALWYRSPEILLGAPFDHPIDMWSVGCIAAEMLMGTPLFPASNQNDVMQRIVSLLGQPPDDLLDRGLYSENFFDEGTSGWQPRGYTLKSPGESHPSTGGNKDVHRKLSDLVKPPLPVPTEDSQDFERDWVFFIDLLERMLHLDPSKRITPEEILSHPFIAFSHLDPQSGSSYVNSSVLYMKAYNTQFVDEGENGQQLSSKPSATPTDEIHVLKTERSENSEEEPSVQEVVTTGANGSPNEGHSEVWDDSGLVNRSPQQNEKEKQCTTSDSTSPPEEKTQSSSKTNVRHGRKKFRRRQQRKARKQNTKSSQ